MSQLLLDTNIVSYLIKGDSRADKYSSILTNSQLAISLMTVAELYQWAAIQNWGNRRIKQLDRYLSANYIIVSIDLQTCQLWGQVRASCRARGRPISPQDAWIAATALQLNCPLVTHNLSDFNMIDSLKLISKS